MERISIRIDKNAIDIRFLSVCSQYCFAAKMLTSDPLADIKYIMCLETMTIVDGNGSIESHPSFPFPERCPLREVDKVDIKRHVSGWGKPGDDKH